MEALKEINFLTNPHIKGESLDYTKSYIYSKKNYLFKWKV